MCDSSSLEAPATGDRKRVLTSSRRLHPARQTQTTESIIEYLIEF